MQNCRLKYRDHGAADYDSVLFIGSDDWLQDSRSIVSATKFQSSDKSANR